MKQNCQKLESIQERDIDLLLMEELNVNNAFADWIIKKLELPSPSTFEGAWHSISEFGLGETDLLLSYTSHQKLIYVLIENKLDASFQDQQHFRYTERARRYEAAGDCDVAVVVLVAPTAYCANQNEFSLFLTYEDIATWFASSGDVRSKYKSEVIELAVAKSRRGYTAINSELVQTFWYKYWKLKREMLPEFQMKEPLIVPYNSDWTILSVDELPMVKFYHKWKQGNVDATFYGLAEDRIEQLEEQCSEPFEVVRHTSGFSLRLRTAVVNRLESFEEQRENVIEGLNCMRELRAYLKSIDL